MMRFGGNLVIFPWVGKRERISSRISLKYVICGPIYRTVRDGGSLGSQTKRTETFQDTIDKWLAV